MFSRNGQISAHQMKAVMALDIFARMSMLVPIYLAGGSMGDLLGCLGIGVIAGWILFIWISGIWTQEEKDLYEYLAEIRGQGCAWIVYLTGGFWCLSQMVVFTVLCAHTAKSYVLPDVPIAVLTIFPVLAGIYLVWSGMEVQGRVSEILMPVLLGLFLLMAVFAASGLDWQEGWDLTISSGSALMGRSFEVFACMGGAFSPVLFFRVQASDSRKIRRSFLKGSIRGSIPAMCLVVLTAVSFGPHGMEEIPFPQIRLMSSARLLGGVVQRWDILFLLLLLSALICSIGSSLCAVSAILQRLRDSYARLKGSLLYDLLQENAENERSDTPAGALHTEFADDLTFQMQDTERRDCRWKELSDAEKRYAQLGAESPSGYGSVNRERSETEETEGYTGVENETRAWYPILLAAAMTFGIYLLATGFPGTDTAIYYFRALNLYILTPITLTMYLCIWFGRIEEKRKRIVSRSTLLLLCVILPFLLSGCTARELEDRIFPMALELRLVKDEIRMTYAWSEQEHAGEGISTEEKKPDGERTDEETEKYLTEFRGGTLEEILQQAEAATERNIDYSHVKAILLDEKLEQDPKLEKSVYEWLIRDPQFAVSLVILPRKKDSLTLKQAVRRSGGDVGTYLENLYQYNQTARKEAETLRERIADYYKHERE